MIIQFRSIAPDTFRGRFGKQVIELRKENSKWVTYVDEKKTNARATSRVDSAIVNVNAVAERVVLARIPRQTQLQTNRNAVQPKEKKK